VFRCGTVTEKDQALQTVNMVEVKSNSKVALMLKEMLTGYKVGMQFSFCINNRQVIFVYTNIRH